MSRICRSNMSRNPEKERAQAYLRTDIRSGITNIVYESNQTQQLVSVLLNLTAGSVIGVDQRLTSQCQNVLLACSSAISLLNQASALVEQLSTEDPDYDE